MDEMKASEQNPSCFFRMKAVLSSLLITLLCTPIVNAFGLSNICYVVDGSGNISSNGSLIKISAGGQPSAVKVSDSGSVAVFSGYLNCFMLQPGLDTDNDGLPDEVDRDNDNDTLKDASEISGSLFSPMTATNPNDPDSDDDGHSDGMEVNAQTNPLDGNVNLRIVGIEIVSNQVYVSYLARGGVAIGKTYVVHTSSNIINLQPSAVATNITPAGGVSPWHVVTNVYITNLATNEINRYYNVSTTP